MNWINSVTSVLKPWSIVMSLLLLSGCDGLFRDLDEITYVGEEDPAEKPKPGAGEGLRLEGSLAPAGGYSQGQKYNLSGRLSTGPATTISKGNKYTLESSLGPTSSK